MKLHAIKLKNFKCFKDLKIDFTAPTGFFYLTGVDLENPNAGANGVGKTTIFDAICWCLYEKTAKKAKAGKILNDQAKQQTYSVQLQIDDNLISRTWGPNSLTINRKPATNEEVVELIGLTFEQFLYAIYFPQGMTHFIDLSASAKLNFLSTLFDLDKWVDYSERASNRVKKIGLEIAQKTATKHSTEGSITSFDEMLAKLKKEHEDWGNIEKNKIAELEKQKIEVQKQQHEWHVENVTKIKQLESELSELKEQVKPVDLDNLNTMKADAVKVQSSYQAAKDTHTRELTKFKQEATKIETHVNIAQAKLVDLQTKASKICPSCEQVITPEHVEKCSKEIEAVVAEYKQQFEPIAEEVSKLVVSLENDEKLIQEGQKLLDMVDQLLKEANFESVKQAQLNGKIEALEKSIREVALAQAPQAVLLQSIEQDLKMLKTPGVVKSPYEAQIEDVEKRKIDAQDLIAKLTQELKELDVKEAQFSYWTQGFKKVRLTILEEVVQELEVHFNQAVAALGFLDWVITISTDKTLKDDSMKKELNLQIFKNGKEKAMELISGGEMQRFRLASAVGIAELIKDRLGVVWNLQMWDEPSLGLSMEGIASMLDFFESLSVSSEIYYADHRVEGLARFDKVFRVVKISDGDSVLDDSGQYSVHSQPVLAGVSS